MGARTSDEALSIHLINSRDPTWNTPRIFYVDTALFGSISGAKCGLDFFGSDNVLFASDSPFDPEKWYIAC